MAKKKSKRTAPKKVVGLNRIITGRGDKGLTSLRGGVRVPKTHPQIVASGEIDELNSVLGMLRGLLEEEPKEISRTLVKRSALFLENIQNCLFDLGAELARPKNQKPSSGRPLYQLASDSVKNIEQESKRLLKDLSPLNSFILPGGDLPTSCCHVARTVCRRAERNLVALSQSQELRPVVLAFVNRLSDYLFVLARSLASPGREKEWKPGSRTKPGTSR